MTTANERRLIKTIWKLWEIVNGSDYDAKTVRKVVKMVGNEIRRQYVREAKEVQNQANI